MAIDKEAFALKANERFKQAREFWHNWRVGARDDYAFVSGDQWLTDDRQVLESQERPAVTFNYSEKMIDAVMGAEVSARQETTYLPRGNEDGPLSELLNAAAKYVRDNCGAEDEESDAFRDALICGMGWTWTHMSYDSDLDGEIDIDRIDPLEMFADPAAIKPGLADRRWQDREMWVSEEEAQKQWPKAFFSGDDGDDKNAGVIQYGNRYNEDVASDDDPERRKGQVKIRLHECYEMEIVYRVATSQGIQEFDEKSFRAAKKQIGDLPEGSFIKQKKRVYYRAFFSGETLLEVMESPCQDGFTFQCITGKRDRNRNYWYGLTRVMKDPQRWANKWLSQIMHIINSNAKGGLLAEVGAFVDPTRAQEEWANADSVTLLNEGGIAKIKEKGLAGYPAGLDKLMNFALESLPMVTGINLEALGLANREQAGVLEQQRKQAAYGLLAPMFDALRRYRKEQGRILLYYIRKYITDGRMIRIGGPELGQYVPLMKIPDSFEYDIIVDQSPNSPDMKDKTWNTLESIIPNMMKAGIPVPPDLLDYAPLPSSLTTKWKQFIGQQQQVNQQMQEQMQALQQENDQLKNDTAIKQQELQFKMQEADAQMQMKQKQMQAEMQLEQEKAQAQFNLEAFKQDRQFELEKRRMQHEQFMKQQQTDNEFRLKAFTAGVKPDDAGKFSIDLQTGDLADLMNQFMQSSAQIMQQAHEASHMTAQALQALQEAMSRPRALVFDQAGRPIGSKLQ